MRRKINTRLIGIAILAILLTLFVAVFIFYDLLKKQVLEDLESYANLLYNEVNSNQEWNDNNQSRIDKLLRITIILPDGTVEYDSVADIKKMRNHKNRVEVKDAISKGEGQAIHKSETLGKNLFYYALRLNDGRILRVSKDVTSIWNVFYKIYPIIIGLTILIVMTCSIIAHFLTKNLITPIKKMADNINDNYKKTDVYPELVPFIQTIYEQHENIMKNAKIRQEFTANVSHELKTPLTSISGYSELIENGMVTEKDVARFAKEIHRNATRLLTLINDIIRLSQLDGTEADIPFEKINIYEIALECISMLQLNAEKHSVQLFVKGDHSHILGNKAMIEEVIFNLCDNGIRYNKEGGTVTVFITEKEQQIILSVKDTGIGIPKKHQERIFERFYRVDKSHSKLTGGTGLGLGIVKHIVLKHNANIGLISEEGEGTEIIIEFPAYKSGSETLLYWV